MSPQAPNVIALPPVPSAPTSVRSTVLFTDIVGSTRHAVAMGDTAWRDALARHDYLVRSAVAKAGGRVVKNTGDGHLITFQSARAAVECAHALVAVARGVGFEIRAGLHTGYSKAFGDDVVGLTVHVAARVCALASPGSILGTAAVALRANDAGVAFADRGLEELRDIPGQFRLFEARPLPW